MYRIESSGALVRAHRTLVAHRRRPVISRTVVLLGLCSLLTDVSSEMVAVVLPLYLVTTLGFSPLQFGIVDGLYQGAAALVRIAGGFAGDRRARHKGIAALGYGLSAVCKLALAVVGSGFAAISAVVLLDRTGKGIRTAPRDAMISMSSREEDLGTAFGVHRAMDTAGAMLGPLVAFALLAALPGAFNTVFIVAFCLGVLGFGVITLLVREPARAKAPPREPVRFRAALAQIRNPGVSRLAVAAVVLGLATTSDGFLYLALQRRLDLDPSLFPLLFTGTAASYMLLAVPAGRLADRFGRARVMLAGYGLLLVVYLSLLVPSAGTAGLVAALVLLGAYYAATDGVLMALASSHVPEALRGSGLALVGTATSVARLLASVAFGALWTWHGIEIAIGCFAVALAGAIAVAATTLRADLRHV